MAEYRADCNRCHVYKSSPTSGDSLLCLRCYTELRWANEDQDRQEKAERRERARARKEQEQLALDQEKIRVSKVPPHCGSCLTTVGVFRINEGTGRGICVRCDAKYSKRSSSSQLAASYVSHTPTMSDPNGIR